MAVPRDLRELEKAGPPPVEVTFSQRCWHGCFQMTAQHGAVWRWPHQLRQTRPGQGIVIHISAHGEAGEYADCQNGCFR